MWVPSPMGAWKRSGTEPFPLVMSCWSSDVSKASPRHLSLFVCFDSSRSAAMTLKVPAEILPWLTPALTFFDLLPKNAELRAAAPELEPCKLNCKKISENSIQIANTDNRTVLIIWTGFRLPKIHAWAVALKPCSLFNQLNTKTKIHPTNKSTHNKIS